jgi:hypothetical protein
MHKLGHGVPLLTGENHMETNKYTVRTYVRKTNGGFVAAIAQPRGKRGAATHIRVWAVPTTITVRRAIGGAA